MKAVLLKDLILNTVQFASRQKHLNDQIPLTIINYIIIIFYALCTSHIHNEKSYFIIKRIKFMFFNYPNEKMT